MELGPGLLVVSIAVVLAVGAAAGTVVAVRSIDALRPVLRERAGRLDERRAGLAADLCRGRGAIEDLRGALERVDSRITIIDGQQERWAADLVARRSEMERMTEEQVLPAARWARRLGLALRLIALRRNVLG